MWFSWLGVVLQNERSQVRFPVRAHAWVVDSVPSQGMREETDHCFSSSLSPSLTLSLKINNKIK